jgi:hypothetical protein
LTRAGWPFTADGPRRGTEEYYEMRAGEPVGERQQYKAGKVWPPDPRACGEPLPYLLRYYAAHYWPHPYREMDRLSVHAIAGAHIATGWQSACTLYDFHFDRDSQVLNSAGRAQLQWILLNVPTEHRQAFVASTSDSRTNSQRLAQVQSAVADMIGEDNTLPVALRMAAPHGRPADEVDAIFDGRMQNMLPPKIEYTSVGTAAPQ